MQCSVSAKPERAVWHDVICTVKAKFDFLNVTKLFQNVKCNFNSLKCSYLCTSHHGDVLHVGINYTTRTHIRMLHINSIHLCAMLSSNMHASHQQPSLLLICFCYQQLQTNPPSTPPFLSSHSYTTTHFLHWLLLVLFPWLCILFT